MLSCKPKKTCESGNNQYKVGMESLTNLLEAQAQWQEAQTQWVEAKAALKMSETQYLKSIGRLAE